MLVEAESDGENSEDVHDGQIVEGIKESDLEDEFMKIEMAQEALENVVKALYRKSQEARKSLDLKDTSAQTDLEKIERPIDELINEAIELASLSFDKQVRATIPNTLRQVLRQISQMSIEALGNSLSPNSVKSSPPPPGPPPPPPPGPPPPPPPATPSNSIKIKSKGSLASISSIQLKSDGKIFEKYFLAYNI